MRNDLLVLKKRQTYQVTHQASRGEVSMEETNEESPGKKDSSPKNDRCRRRAYGISERIETDRGRYETAQQRNERRQVDCQEDCHFPQVPAGKRF